MYLWVYSGTQWTNQIQHADAYPNRFRLFNPLDNRHSNRHPNPHCNRHRNQHDGTVCLYAESRNHTCRRHGDSLSGQNQSPSASKPNGNETMTMSIHSIAFTNDHGHRHRQHTANQREPNHAAPRRRPGFSRRTVEYPDSGHIVFTQYNGIPTVISQHTMKHTV